MCLLCCWNHSTVRSVPSGRHWYQLVCGLVRLPGCQSIRNCQPSGKMRNNLGSYACSSLFGVSRKSFETHATKPESFKVFFLICFMLLKRFFIHCEDAWFFHDCLLPPASCPRLERNLVVKCLSRFKSGLCTFPSVPTLFCYISSRFPSSKVPEQKAPQHGKPVRREPRFLLLVMPFMPRCGNGITVREKGRGFVPG